MNKKFLLVGVLVVLAAIGVIIGVVVSNGDDSSSKEGNSNSGGVDTNTDGTTDNSADETDNGNTDNTSGTVKPPVDGSTDASTDGSKTEGPTKKPKLTSEPREASYPLTAFAVGDWGTTTVADSCCNRRKDGKFNQNDVHAQDLVATLMDRRAGDMAVKPSVVIGHGDNFYWTGINSVEGRDQRFQTTFERKFNGANLQDIPWVNVFGNHDYGGSSYICSSGDEPAPCGSAAELVQALKDKFEFQRSYKSAMGDRWIMSDHFYVHTIEDAASGVSMDIYNIDTNDAEAHGARQICCQCYGYASGGSCSQAIRGEKRCANGDVGMYDACYDQLMAWGEESRAALLEHATTSNATWKVVNSHYSPYGHYTDSRFPMWFKLLKEAKLHLWIYGHTHGEKHDYSPYLETHFIENGAGGGIQSESASGIVPSVADKVKRVWSYEGDRYGFFSLEASTEWLKAQYHTYPKGFMAGKKFNGGDVPGVSTNHCWYIPVNHMLGQVCDAGAEYPPASSEILDMQ